MAENNSVPILVHFLYELDRGIDPNALICLQTVIDNECVNLRNRNIEITSYCVSIARTEPIVELDGGTFLIFTNINLNDPKMVEFNIFDTKIDKILYACSSDKFALTYEDLFNLIVHDKIKVNDVCMSLLGEVEDTNSTDIRLVQVNTLGDYIPDYKNQRVTFIHNTGFFSRLYDIQREMQEEENQI